LITVQFPLAQEGSVQTKETLKITPQIFFFGKNLSFFGQYSKGEQKPSATPASSPTHPNADLFLNYHFRGNKSFSILSCLNKS
jgi:hypothetical protein